MTDWSVSRPLIRPHFLQVDDLKETQIKAPLVVTSFLLPSNQISRGDSSAEQSVSPSPSPGKLSFSHIWHLDQSYYQLGSRQEGKHSLLVFLSGSFSSGIGGDALIQPGLPLQLKFGLTCSSGLWPFRAMWVQHRSGKGVFDVVLPSLQQSYISTQAQSSN